MDFGNISFKLIQLITMKKKVIIIIGLCLNICLLQAQNDTIYIMKSGAIIKQYNIKTEVDSIIFYTPIINQIYPPSPVNIPNAITFNPVLKYDTVKDIDGNIYKTITIGKHQWMAENLRVTRYRNGDPIPCIVNKEDWAFDEPLISMENRGLCVYNNDNNVDSIAKYGLLYGYGTIQDARRIAPLGWHIATDNEWLEIIYDRSNTLKYRGADWSSSTLTDNTSINNYGLTILPSGCRSNNGNFNARGSSFITCTGFNGNNSYISFNGSFFDFVGDGQLWNRMHANLIGYSIRCVKDE